MWPNNKVIADLIEQITDLDFIYVFTIFSNPFLVNSFQVQNVSNYKHTILGFKSQSSYLIIFLECFELSKPKKHYNLSHYYFIYELDISKIRTEFSILPYPWINQLSKDEINSACEKYIFNRGKSLEKNQQKIINWLMSDESLYQIYYPGSVRNNVCMITITTQPLLSLPEECGILVSTLNEVIVPRKEFPNSIAESKKQLAKHISTLAFSLSDDINSEEEFYEQLIQFFDNSLTL